MKNSKKSLAILNRSVVPKEILIFTIRAYQLLFSPDHGVFARVLGCWRCRFFPTCSVYAIKSLRQYGLLKGSVVSLWRVLRCGPWSRGGYDP